MKRSTIEWASILKKCGVASREADVWSPVFAMVIDEHTFSDQADLPTFLGQMLHESAMLTRLEEGLSYRAERIRQIGLGSRKGSRWRSLVSIADTLAGNPVGMANALYGGRLGNIYPGDGWRYRGSGPIQLTGRDNFAAMQKATGIQLLEHPDVIRRPGPAALRVAIAWWEKNVPDEALQNERLVTIEVNGGLTGLADRVALTNQARAALA